MKLVHVGINAMIEAVYEPYSNPWQYISEPGQQFPTSVALVVL